jgi:5'(3')-deoxyribonucleotidase
MGTEAKFVLGVDLDGVVADFYSGLREIAAEWLDVPIESLSENVSHGLTEWKVPDAPGGYEALHRFAITQRELFKRLKPIAGAPATLRRLSSKEIRIRIITHRLFIKYFHQEAVRQTIEWLDHYDIPYWDLCFMKDKAAVGADLYIEDTPANVEQLRADEHPTLVFSNSTNLALGEPRAKTWEEVERFVLSAKAAWKKGQKSHGRHLPGE